jgi:hypothetical protein
MPVRKGYLIVLALVLVSIASGCKEAPKNPVEEYGMGLVNSLGRSKEAARAANLDALRRTIAAFRAANGRYPQSLEEIASFMGSDVEPDIYDYDPETGKIALRE